MQVGAGRSRPNSKPKVHSGIDLLFADVPKNLLVPTISASASDVPSWNKRSETYFEVLFAFASANLHDNGVLVFAHSADPEVSRSIHNWAHTEDFYVAEDWFGMNDLDLQSPTNPSELVISCLLHPFPNLPYFFPLCSLNSVVHFLLQTRKFFIKVLVRNQSVLNVRSSELQGYNLKRDGWLNSFVDANNQSMRDDGMPWRGAREKGPDFFSILFSALTDKDDIIMDWQCGVGMLFICLFLIFTFFPSFVLFCFPFIPIYSHLRIWLY